MLISIFFSSHKIYVSILQVASLGFALNLTIATTNHGGARLREIAITNRG
jgi:hypothetical protein